MNSYPHIPEDETSEAKPITPLPAALLESDAVAAVQMSVNKGTSLNEAEAKMSKMVDKIYLDLRESIPKERISRLIEMLNRRKIMLHGVKTSELWGQVKENGVRPLTPEGGYASYWTSGYRVFHNGDERMTSYDTTFFHYGMGEASPSEVTMSLVLTDVDTLSIYEPAEASSKYETDGYIKLNKPVPKEAACFLHVKLDKQGAPLDASGVVRVEVAMFELLEKIAREGFTSGEIIEMQLPTAKETWNYVPSSFESSRAA